MTPIIIYRLEDSNGDGVFRGTHAESGLSYTDHIDRSFGTPCHKSFNRHTMPSRDEKLRAKLDKLFDGDSWCWNMDTEAPWMKFGFASIAQLLYWFHEREWLEKLSSLGIRLNKYAVYDTMSAIEGDTQVVFDVRSAVLMGTYLPQNATEID